MSGWGEQLAIIWTNNVQPSRPSNEEMVIYTKYLRFVQKNIGNRKAKLLVLGSTPEFRDWGYEQNLDITVVDKSKEYYDAISKEIRHKNIKEKLIVSEWECMSFHDEFDVIIGDLAIGNVDSSRFDNFLECVRLALSDKGIFIGKSFIWKDDKIVHSPEEIIDIYRKKSYIHPYNIINHMMALYCVDREKMELDFSVMYNLLKELEKNNYLTSDIMSYFENIGWNTEMKFKFFSPSQVYFREKINQHLQFIKYEFTNDEFTHEFPVYIAKKED